MLDITSTFDELLKQHNAPPTKKTLTIGQVDEFLREAYKIHKQIASLHDDLKNVRLAYLSTAQPRRTAHHRTKSQPQERFMTDHDRDSLDANAKGVLHTINRSIQGLAHAQSLHEAAQENLLRKKYASPLARFGKWAEGGMGLGGKSPEYIEEEERQRQVAGHREGVLWLLRQRLQQCGQLQQSMMETRLTREVEKNRSVLAKAKLDMRLGNSFREAEALQNTTAPAEASNGTIRAGPSAALLQDEERKPKLQLTDEQVQMFEKDSQDMLKHYQGTLDKVLSTEKSIHEISELQTSLVTNLEMQSAHIEQLVMDSLHTTDNVDKGNRELKKAVDRPSTARYTFFVATGLCAFVLVWDFFV